MSKNKPLELLRLNSVDPRPAFSSGDGDIDEFFHTDSLASCDELMSVTYALIEGGVTVAFFSLSNDSIPLELLERRAWKRIRHGKRYKSLPAAKIGRIGVSKNVQSKGIGTRVLDYLKAWFTEGNKTGCRYLVVDAYNKPRVLKFYKKNGFEFLTTSDEHEDTRIMYFDLILFIRAAKDAAATASA